MKQFTDIAIKNLKTKTKQYEIFENRTPGFGIRVSPGNTKSFVYLYRIGTRQRRMTLGAYPHISLTEARKRAADAHRLKSEGIDPAIEKQANAASYRDELFPMVVDAFVELYAQPNTASWKATQMILQKKFAGRWAKTRLRDINRSAVKSALNDIAKTDGPSAANYAFATIRKFFNWCVEEGRIKETPCDHVKAPAKTKTRDKVLTDREIERVWNSAADMGFPFGPFIRLVLLTGQRRCEVAKLRWSDIDFEKKEWVQPETSNKSRRTHIVPLSEAAIDLLQSLPRFQSEWVFPATSGDHAISGFSKWKAELDRLSHTSGWTIHDLRRTMTTRMAMARVPSVVVELILNHSRRASNPIAAVYNRYDYMDERRTALEEWAKTVIAIAQPSIDLAR